MTEDTRKTRKDGSKSLRVDLNPDITEILFNIMDERKFQSYAEAIRYCIIETDKSTEFRLEEGYWKKIREVLKFDYVHNKERIYDIQAFVNKGIDKYIEYIEKNTQSILSFEVRSELQGEDLNVAMAFIECQEENTAEQVTVEVLAQKMDRRNTKELGETLDDFVRRGILDKMVHQSDVYYHAKKVEAY